jgi:hypothetical protein
MIGETTQALHQCDSWAPPEVLRDLPMSQSGDGRHKCATCAYARGVADAFACPVPEQLAALIELLDTQSDPHPEDAQLIAWLQRGLP